MYRVLHYFVDLTDGGRPYNEGALYPAKDAAEPSAERVASLLGAGNKQGQPLIAAAEDAKKAGKEAKPAAEKKAAEPKE